MSDLPVLRVPARDIPVPTSVSAEAQAVLAARPAAEPESFPTLEDREGWLAHIASHNDNMLAMVGDAANHLPAHIDELVLSTLNCPVYVVTPDGVGSNDRRVVLEIHGGGFIHGGGQMCRITAVVAGLRFGTPVWAVDYRMPPDHPYPTPLDDCMAAYRALLDVRRPTEIVVSGGSAGGNLAAALILRARDEGLPLPTAAVLNTPAADLTDSGDSLHTNRGLDPILANAESVPTRVYTAGHDLTDPYVSPLFGDFTLGFPPTILTTGTRDLYLSNTVRMHRALRAAGIEAELHVLEAGGHGGFFMAAPEDREIDNEVRRFAEAHWAQRDATRGRSTSSRGKR